MQLLATPEVKDGIFYSRHIVITKTGFNDFCSRKDFEDSQIILKNWKVKGLLKSEKDRMVSDRKIKAQGTAVKCYIIRVLAERTPQDSNMPHYTKTSGQTGEEDFFAEESALLGSRVQYEAQPVSRNKVKKTRKVG